ncbi:hypothetical protein [Fulvivirga sp.]|uniref:hypothetical protein n=1 Tax=Fulvivirga sp. TaxID=1931237 RepID=UPI0032ED1D93
MKSKEALLKDVIWMRDHGETIRSISSFLEANCDDPEIIKSVIILLEAYDREKEGQGLSWVKMLTLSNILGVIFLCSGLFMVFYLWGMGWVSTVPFILIGIGVLALTGSIK